MIFFRLLSLLPFSALYRLSDLLYFLAYKLFRYRRKVVDTNLRNAFPDKTDEEINLISKGYYKNLCDIVVETIKVLSLKKETLKEKVKFRNINLPLKSLEKGQSIIVLCGHTANWEWLLLACSIESSFPIDAVYKPLSNKFFDRLMLDIRTKFGAYPLPMQDVPRSLVSRRNTIRGIAMVADQTPPKNDIQHWNYFLDQETPWYIGGEKIARLGEMPVFFVGMRRIRRGEYEVSFEKISQPPYEKSSGKYPIIDRYADMLEQNILENPEQWLWSHRRWKHSK